MKKSLCTMLVLTVSAFSVFADAFTDAIQDLAIQTACIGQYSATQAGGGWYDDPHDYYTPQMMAERFAKMSGNMTRTTTFYGVCFDYAQFAWNDINQYKSWYNEQGMYEAQFWIAGNHANSNEIILQYPGTRNDHTTVQNGVYVKIPQNGNRSVKSHRLMNKGNRATNHAWLWIQRADGVQFWIDPTWTDNLGYVVYGYVSSSGEEIQCRPDRDFCINYPSELNNLPLPPAMGARKAPSPSANSTNRNETIKDAGTSWIKLYDATIDYFFDGLYEKNFISFLASANVPFLSFADGSLNVNQMVRSLNVNQMAFALETPVLLNDGFAMLGLEYLRNIDDDYSIHSALFTTTGTHRLTSFFSWYLGIGFGLRFDTSNDDNYVPGKIEHLARTGWFAFKGDIGFLLNISQIFYTKIGAAYDNVLGFSVEAGIGFGFKRH